MAIAVAVWSPPEEAEAGSRSDRVERKIVKKINRIRAANGLRAVKANRRLGRSADVHCADMLRENFFAHTSSNGQSFAQRVHRYRPSKRIGETLAYVAGKRARGQAKRVVRMWMNSPPHRASLLNGGFRRVGVARRNGRLGSMRATVFTADFASKR